MTRSATRHVPEAVVVYEKLVQWYRLCGYDIYEFPRLPSRSEPCIYLNFWPQAVSGADLRAASLSLLWRIT